MNEANQNTGAPLLEDVERMERLQEKVAQTWATHEATSIMSDDYLPNFQAALDAKKALREAFIAQGPALLEQVRRQEHQIQKLREPAARAAVVLEAAARFIDVNDLEYEKVDYDGTDCDGYCLMEDCRDVASWLGKAMILSGGASSGEDVGG